jgi:FkbM family methyltransferase
MKARVVGPLLWVYERAAKSGLLDHRVPRRAFESAYLVYKLLIEAGPVERLKPLVATGSTVIDVGANIGFFALRFGRWVGPAGHVIAIEPEERNMAALRRRVRRAGLESVIDCVEAAAAERSGEVRLAVIPGHPGGHHLADDGDPVRAVTIDELAASASRRVALIKLDVQGAELRVLNGAARVIETHRPAIFIEVDDSALERRGSSARTLIETLDALGFAGHRLTRRGIGPTEAPESLVASSANGYIDVLFLPEPRP